MISVVCFLTEPDLADVARALAHAGQPDRAEILARSLTDPYLQARVLAAAARALAEAGQANQATIVAAEAETAACSLTDPDRRARAVVDVALTCMAGGDIRQARRMASAACAAGPWTIALEAVLLLEPSAVKVLIDL